MPTAAPPKCAADETELIPAFLFECADDLEQNPKHENEPGRQSNPAKPDDSQAAICFQDSSGAALSKSEPSACFDKRSTSAMASNSRAFCGSSGAARTGWRGTSVSTSCASNRDEMTVRANIHLDFRMVG